MKILYKSLLILTLMFSITINSIVFAQQEPVVSGESVLLMEQTTDSIVYSKEPNKRMFPASTTKMITALVTLDYLSGDQLITVGEEINNLPPNSSTAGVSMGESLIVDDALRGLLMASGNELACVLALNVAQQAKDKTMTYEEAEVVFSELMNQKAKSLGATNSNFVNPHGYHNENHYSTTKDLYIIAKALLSNDKLSSIVATKAFKGNSADRETYPDKKIRSYDWTNSNRLISSTIYNYEFTTGIKTGSTVEAGKCLVASAQKDGKKLIAVILNSSEAGRWQDTIKLFDYGFNNFEITLLQKKGEIVDTVAIRNNGIVLADDVSKAQNKPVIDIIADEDIKGFVSLNDLDSIYKETKYYSDVNISTDGQSPMLSLPLKSGESIGMVSYKIGDKTILEKEITSPLDMEINLSDNKDYYKRAIEQRNKKNLIKFIIIFVIIISLGGLIFMGLRFTGSVMNKRKKRIRRRRIR